MFEAMPQALLQTLIFVTTPSSVSSVSFSGEAGGLNQNGNSTLDSEIGGLEEGGGAAMGVLWLQVAAIASSCVSVAFISSNMSFDLDHSPRKRRLFPEVT